MPARSDDFYPWLRDKVQGRLGWEARLEAVMTVVLPDTSEWFERQVNAYK